MNPFQIVLPKLVAAINKPLRTSQMRREMKTIVDEAGRIQSMQLG